MLRSISVASKSQLPSFGVWSRIFISKVKSASWHTSLESGVFSSITFKRIPSLLESAFREEYFPGECSVACEQELIRTLLLYYGLVVLY